MYRTEKRVKPKPKLGRYIYKYVFDCDNHGILVFKEKEKLHVKVNNGRKAWIARKKKHCRYNPPVLFRLSRLKSDLEDIVPNNVCDYFGFFISTENHYENYSYESFSGKEIQAYVDKVNSENLFMVLERRRRKVMEKIDDMEIYLEGYEKQLKENEERLGEAYETN